ncbi:PMT-2 domain-containing protein [Chitinophaga sp. 180180018-2]|nr:PMT-2 domain-containing protein [Chitinophaga sp. 212800010-3]
MEELPSNSSYLPIHPISLKDYVLKNPTNKRYLIIGLITIFLQFTIFKYFYPFAGYINGDSYVYLETAYHNFSVNTYPVGYSNFLRLISVFTKSDIIVVAIQYLLLQFSALSLLFTLFYFYSPAKLTRIILFLFITINPASLYLSNYISSDCFFLSLSIAWFTLLLWTISYPSKKLILITSLLLFIAFTVRYNALFYPIISVIALVLSRKKILLSIGGFAVSLILIGIFIIHTSKTYYKLSGYKQFSPFTGWQLANNGMYAYKFVAPKNRKQPPKRLQELDQMVRNYIDSTQNLQKYPYEKIIAGTIYMWSPNSPLSIYMNKQFIKDSTATALTKWSATAPIMKEYGIFLIKSYPKEFLRYYLIPNAVKYYAPPVEFLAAYSTGVDSVSPIATAWFAYKSNKISCRFKDFNVNNLNYYPILSGTVNVLFIFSLLSFIMLKGYKEQIQLTKGLGLVIGLWIVNFSFSVFASPIALRFQLFPILTTACFSLLLLEYLIKLAKSSNPATSNILNTSTEPPNIQAIS